MQHALPKVVEQFTLVGMKTVKSKNNFYTKTCEHFYFSQFHFLTGFFRSNVSSPSIFQTNSIFLFHIASKESANLPKSYKISYNNGLQDLAKILAKKLWRLANFFVPGLYWKKSLSRPVNNKTSFMSLMSNNLLPRTVHPNSINALKLKRSSLTLRRPKQITPLDPKWMKFWRNHDARDPISFPGKPITDLHSVKSLQNSK